MGLQNTGDRLQNKVASLVAVGIVNGLEMVQVDHRNRRGRLGANRPFAFDFQV